MASLYQRGIRTNPNRKIWHVSFFEAGKRITKSLKTSDRSKAEEIAKTMTESNVIEHKDDSAFVYLFNDKLTGLTKIGISKNPQKRAAGFKTTIPQGELVGSFKTAQPLIVEKYLHHKFKPKNKGREWFNLCEHDIEHILNFKTNEILNALKN